MTSLGIIPVIPAFNGIVPTELLDLFPNETYYPLRHGFEYSGHEGLLEIKDDFNYIPPRFIHERILGNSAAQPGPNGQLS